jgi:putative DNA primase/helicase
MQLNNSAEITAFQDGVTSPTGFVMDGEEFVMVALPRPWPRDVNTVICTSEHKLDASSAIVVPMPMPTGTEAKEWLARSKDDNLPREARRIFAGIADKMEAVMRRTAERMAPQDYPTWSQKQKSEWIAEGAAAYDELKKACDQTPVTVFLHVKSAVPAYAHDLTGSCSRASPPGNGPARKPAIILLNAEEIEPEPVDWLWNGWLAKRKLHLFAGVPETGKTTLALSYAATISAGMHWPDGTCAPLGNVLIWTSEDGVADTIIPRLTRMVADLKRIKIVGPHQDVRGLKRPFNPATDMRMLAEAVKNTPGGVVLAILDPVVAAVPLTRNSHNNAETRSGLQPVVDFAEETSAAVIGISHFTKGTAGKDPIERVTGSLAFGALPRIVMAAAKNSKEGGGPPRILVRAKSNIGKSGGGFGYDIDAAPLHERPDVIATRIVWLDPLDGTAKELLSDAEGEDANTQVSKTEMANRFLQKTLAKGERPAKELFAEAQAEGIGERTLQYASKVMISKRKDGSGGWHWRLT